MKQTLHDFSLGFICGLVIVGVIWSIYGCGI